MQNINLFSNLKRDYIEIFLSTQKTAIPTHKIITAQI